jgi:hypothetical protein
MPLVTKTFSEIITFTRASSGTYFDATGTLQTATTNAARFDYDPSALSARGFLVEEQRTNSIRNNTMVGAVAGTPGTAPTNWTLVNPSDGITQQIIETGTEKGITYIDVKYSGTASSSSFKIVRFESISNIVASSGQSWTASTYMKVAGGSTANISAFEHVAVGYTSGGVVSESTNAAPSLTSTLTRFITSRTLNNATTAFVSSYFAFSFLNGAAIDITLRIGLPQLEQGAFATSVISTSSAAATRSADVASVNTLSPWYNASEGTIYAEAVRSNIPVSTNGNAVDISDGTTNNRARLWIWSGNASQIAFTVASGGSSVADLNPGSVSANTVFKVAGSYKANDFATSINGGTVATDASGAAPVSPNIVNLGTRSGGSSEFWNGHLRRITYYPRRLSNSELQGITT